jgi:hypothetical protein
MLRAQHQLIYPQWRGGYPVEKLLRMIAPQHEHHRPRQGQDSGNDR